MGRFLLNRIVYNKWISIWRFMKERSKRQTILIISLSITVVMAVTFATCFFIQKDEIDRQIDANRVCTTYNKMGIEDCIDSYIGLSEEEAVSRAEHYGYWIKIIKTDSESDHNYIDIGGPWITLITRGDIIVGVIFERW